jgi:nucleoid DNA-binding protein
MKTKVGWRSAGRKTYDTFCLEHPSIKLSYDEWKNIIYSFNESVRDYVLETGEKVKLPFGFGEFSINKKKNKRFKEINGEQKVVLPIDWKKTKEKGKKIYNFNHHTEGFYFGWVWFKKTSTLRFREMWYFKASRPTSRLLAHYLKVDGKYQHLYREWSL